MKNTLLFLAFCLLSTPSQAAEKTFFFGGAQAQKGQMDACIGGTKNFGMAQWQSGVSAALAEMNAPANLNKPYTVVGHSSGAKYANQVASQARNPQRITLIDLDGFAPRNVPKGVNRVCWKATNGRGLSSRNAGSMAPSNGCQTVKTATAPQCSTTWCLHFALVNANVPGNLNNSTWVSQGYSHCKAFTGWQQ